MKPEIGTRMVRGFALAVLGAIVAAALWTWEPGSRVGAPSFEVELEGPAWLCPTGYDHLGRCVGRNLAGGVHVFLLPGLLAAMVTGVTGIALGLGVGYAGGWVRTLSRAGMTVLESLPRLMILLVVFLLWRQSRLVLGIALGILIGPALAAEIAERLLALARTDFVRATRTHGVPESRVLVHHLVWLSCRGEIIRKMVLAFGYLVIAETSLSYVLQHNTAGWELSWGAQLEQSSLVLYDWAWSVSHWYSSGRLDPFPTTGLAQFLSVAGAVVLVLWATQRVGECVATALEKEH